MSFRADTHWTGGEKPKRKSQLHCHPAGHVTGSSDTGVTSPTRGTAITSMRPLRNTQLHPVLKHRPALRLGAGTPAPKPRASQTQRGGFQASCPGRLSESLRGLFGKAGGPLCGSWDFRSVSERKGIGRYGRRPSPAGPGEAAAAETPLASTFLFVKQYRPKRNKPEVLQD